jgi:hypothetical protein
MSDIRQKNVETYVRDLIFKRFELRQGDAKDRYRNRSKSNNSKPKSENPATNPSDNGIGDSS